MAAALKSSRKPGKFAQMTYFQIMAKAVPSQDERPKLPIGRGGKQKELRRFHILEDGIKALKVEFDGGSVFPNPFSTGFYHYSIEALKQLGVNSRHKLSSVHAAIKELMSDSSTQVEDENGKKTTAWQRFRDKPTRNPETGLDVDGRILQNLQVLQRIGGKTPYGYKINQVAQEVMGLKGASLDLDRAPGGEIYVNLNLEPTNIVKFETDDGFVRIAIPFNGLRRRASGEDAVKVKVVKAKVAKAKVAKAERSSKPRVKKEAEPVVEAPEIESTQVVEEVTPVNAEA